MESRINKEMAIVVIKGLIMASTLPISEVVARMSRQGVPDDVIERVFIAPKIHRATDIDKSVGVM